MFVSLPPYEFNVPAEIAPPGARYWRSLGMSVNAAWFLLTVRLRTPERLRDSFLIAWDFDLVDALATLDADPVALMCIAPDSRRRGLPWKAVPIHEIWTAASPLEGKNTCILFVGADGKEYSGLLFDQARLIVRQELIARFEAATPSPIAEERQP